MKRAFDVVFSACFLWFVLPLLVFAAVGIALTSRGPIFYRATRVGKGNVPFTMLKFRTMHVGNSGSVITSANDPRIFRFGSFLRKTKIDELPQFINVLFGDMSIVGPRPEDPKIVQDHYTDWMMETLSVAPGITSLGSIFYYLEGEELIDDKAPEESYVNRLLPAKLALEMAYLERRSFFADLGIVVQTVIAVAARVFRMRLRVANKDRAVAARWAAIQIEPGTTE